GAAGLRDLGVVRHASRISGWKDALVGALLVRRVGVAAVAGAAVGSRAGVDGVLPIGVAVGGALGMDALVAGGAGAPGRGGGGRRKAGRDYQRCWTRAASIAEDRAPRQPNW